jgi:Glyoxalase-like domain
MFPRSTSNRQSLGGAVTLNERCRTPLWQDGVVTSRISCVVVDAVDPGALVEFWTAVLGWVVVDQDETGVSLAEPGTSLPTLDLIKVPEAKEVKNRLHIDLRADGISTAEELDRLLGLGATRVDIGQEPDVTWVVLADPAGNEFCLLQRTVQEVEAGVDG